MYALVIDNTINKIITSPKSLVIGDVRYPAKIFQLWTKAEKEAIGLYEVVTDASNFKDEEYYINTDEKYNFADGQVTRSWGTATAKRLNDEDAVDNDGNNILDEDGNQVINYGLKTKKKKIIKQQAENLLAPTDWYVVKATEVEDYSVPSNITTFRANVRAKSNEMETAIDNAADVDALKTLYDYTEQEDGSVTRPLGEFPILED
tara:strand:- start:152 stop:766 length:615 start_codon:yes stop_codon:yes gene_type:complete